MLDPDFGFRLRYRIHATNRLHGKESELGADEVGEVWIYLVELMVLVWVGVWGWMDSESKKSIDADGYDVDSEESRTKQLIQQLKIAPKLLRPIIFILYKLNNCFSHLYNNLKKELKTIIEVSRTARERVSRSRSGTIRIRSRSTTTTDNIVENAKMLDHSLNVLEDFLGEGVFPNGESKTNSMDQYDNNDPLAPSATPLKSYSSSNYGTTSDSVNSKFGTPLPLSMSSSKSTSNCNINLSKPHNLKVMENRINENFLKCFDKILVKPFTSPDSTTRVKFSLQHLVHLALITRIFTVSLALINTLYVCAVGRDLGVRSTSTVWIHEDISNLMMFPVIFFMIPDLVLPEFLPSATFYSMLSCISMEICRGCCCLVFLFLVDGMKGGGLLIDNGGKNITMSSFSNHAAIEEEIEVTSSMTNLSNALNNVTSPYSNRHNFFQHQHQIP